jgi:hypothetical protein
VLLLFCHEKLCGAVIFGWAAHRAGNLASAVEVDGRVGPGVYEVVVLEMVDPEAECAHVTGLLSWTPG